MQIGFNWSMSYHGDLTPGGSNLVAQAPELALIQNVPYPSCFKCNLLFLSAYFMSHFIGVTLHYCWCRGCYYIGLLHRTLGLFSILIETMLLRPETTLQETRLVKQIKNTLLCQKSYFCPSLICIYLRMHYKQNEGPFIKSIGLQFGWRSHKHSQRRNTVKPRQPCKCRGL